MGTTHNFVKNHRAQILVIMTCLTKNSNWFELKGLYSHYFACPFVRTVCGRFTVVLPPGDLTTNDLATNKLTTKRSEILCAIARIKEKFEK